MTSKSTHFLIIALSLLTALSFAQANESCLREVSNSSLLAELDKRLGSTGNRGEVYMIATCEGAQISIEAYTHRGRSSVLEYHTSDVNLCKAFASQINERGNRNTQMVAICDGAQLRTILVSSMAEFTSHTRKVNDVNACFDLATEINRR